MITVRMIAAATAGAFGVELKQLLHRSGTRQSAEARQAAMWLSSHLTPCTFDEIGTELGGRGRNTVRHSVEKIQEARRFDQKLAERLDGITALARRMEGLHANLGAEPNPEADVALAAMEALSLADATPAERAAAQAALQPPIDVAAVARRALSGIRGATSISVHELQAIARAVLTADPPINEEGDENAE